MILRPQLIRKTISVFSYVLVSVLLVHVLIWFFRFSLYEIWPKYLDLKSFLVDFAPEIWFTLLSIVLGTLIIVISIASQSNPKLIDYYIGDLPSLYYMSMLCFMGLESIFLQLDFNIDSFFISNAIFLNTYVLLPLAILLALPYSFYILSYTKTSSLIYTIFKKNRGIIRAIAGKKHIKNINDIHFDLLDTINQLDDQHGYVPFKEPKSQIVHLLAELIKIFLNLKQDISSEFYKITKPIKKDISFRTLTDKIKNFEDDQTFFEHKIYRVFSGIYHRLLDQSHHDLASQCASELAEVGVVAAKTQNHISLDLVLIQFNTFLRFGIKHAIQTKDVRNIYNCIYHYTDLVLHLLSQKQYAHVIKTCEYMTYYGREIYKLSFHESQFIFLIDAFASEIQKILISANEHNVDREIQMQILKIYATLEPDIEKNEFLVRVKNNTARAIKIALILFYIEKKSIDFILQLVEDITDDLRYFQRKEVLSLIKKDCNFLQSCKETFWEYTDRGDQNIYYTPYKKHLKEFYKIFSRHYLKLTTGADSVILSTKNLAS